MNKAALFVLIALAAGLGVGYLLGSNTPATAERTERQDQPVYEPPPVERDADRPRTKLTEALDDMPAPQFPVGKGRITGTVKTDDGKPLRGVLVRATPRWRGSGRPYWQWLGAPREDSLEETVRRTVERYHRNRGTRRDAVTAADGSYTIEGLVGSEKYNVQAYLENYKLAAQSGHQAYEVAPGAKIDFVAKPIARLHVDVVMPDGSRPERANLHFRGKNRSEAAQWTPEYPTVGVASGTYALTATLDSDSDYTAEPTEIEVSHDKPNPPVTIHMRSQPGIRATVKLPEGATVQYLQVYAIKMRPDEPPPLDRLRDGKRSHLGRGSYTFKGLAPGRYLVAVALGSETVLDSRTVDVTDHMVRCDFDIREFNPADFISVRVSGPDGKPVPGVNFGTAFRTKSGSSSGGGQSIALKDRYLVPHHKGDHPDGTHYVTARSEKYGLKEIAYSREKTRELEIRFGEPAKLTVTGYAGGAEGKLAVRLARKDAQRHSPYREEKMVPANGTLILGPTEAGEYELRLYVQVNRYSRLRVSTTPIALRAGDNTATIAVPRLYALTIVVPDGRGQVQIGPDPRRDEWFHAYQELGKTGRVTFTNLVAGRYKVTNGGEEMVIDLRATQTVTFEPQDTNAMRVSITDPNGAFAAAGLVHGDLIIGVDGTEFKNPRHMMIMIMAGGKEPITLNILRGGRRIELTVDVKSLRGGGRLDSTTR